VNQSMNDKRKLRYFKCEFKSTWSSLILFYKDKHTKEIEDIHKQKNMQCKTNQQKQNDVHANKIKVQVIGCMNKCMNLFLGMPKPPTLGRSLIIHPQGVMDFHFLVLIPFPPMNNPNTFQLVQPMDYITRSLRRKGSPYQSRWSDLFVRCLKPKHKTMGSNVNHFTTEVARRYKL